jgi:hypothetical protein
MMSVDYRRVNVDNRRLSRVSSLRMKSGRAYLDQVKRRSILTGIADYLGRSSVATIMDASILDVRADLAIEIDEHECARRIDANAGRFDDFDTVMFLMGLPHHEAVPIASLSAEERRMLDRAPGGSVDVRGDSVIRLACPPTRSVLAVVYDDDWLRGLRAASVFAPVATRMLIMPTLPADAGILLAEAAEYGIGVGTPSDTGVAIHLAPQVWRQRYFTPGGWLFREQVYQLAASQGVTAPS